MLNQQELRERKRRIYGLRKEGKTLSEIGALYNISRERVRGLCREAKFEEEILPTLPPLVQRLSARARTCLRTCMGDDILSHPERIVALGRIGLLKFYQLGRKTADEISAALEELGYITDIEKWYGRVYQGRDRGMTHIGATWITDIRHFLNEKGEIPPDMPPHAKALALHFGRIIEAASQRRNGAQAAPTDIPCRRKPGNRKCGSSITVGTSEDESIEWRCPSCGDNGMVSGWQGTKWDKRR